MSKTNLKAASCLMPLANGYNIRVDCFDEGIFRIRVGNGKCHHESGMNRYGIIRDNAKLAHYSKNTSEWLVETAKTKLHISTKNGAFALRNHAGRPILKANPPKIGEAGSGFSAGFQLKAGERLYGLGDVDRTRLNRRGSCYEMMIKNVIGYAPVPFLMSSAGWAIFLNTTWFHNVDAAATHKNTLDFKSKYGSLDYYLISGDFPQMLLELYTRITGKPTLLPEWAYGLTFICDERGLRARDMLYEAYEFRRHGIPCDIIGLEPGWMEKNYDLTVEKTWSKERFHVPPYMKTGHFTQALKAIGFKLSLWLCCDYDLTEHEERQLRRQTLDDMPVSTITAVPEAEIDDQRLKGARYMDDLTKPGVAWFEHLKKFIDDGARAFKLDACAQVNRHPDRKWYNGMDDRELHNLHPVLYGKQMNRGFAEYTGKRPMINIALGYAGIQQYAAMWAGDTGGGAKPLTSLLNHGFCGHSNVTTDMKVDSEQGIHFGFLQAWSQINSWHAYREPWFQGERLMKIFADYARWRYRLLPYIYSMAHVAHRTGLPIMRAMPLVFSNDPESDNLILQYMFGDALLTAAFSDSIYLPEGEWFDYWTGKRCQGGVKLPAQYPENKGGPLFARAGSIIPMGPEVAYFGQKPMDTIWLDVFPGNRTEPFMLYEDDGDTEAYREGCVATTEFNQKESNGNLKLSVSPRKGSYDGMSAKRCYVFQVHCARPREVRIDKKILADWRYDDQAATLFLPELAAVENEKLLLDIMI